MTKVFSSFFPLVSQKSIDDLVELTSEWISESSHNDLNETDLELLAIDEFSLKKQNNSLIVIRGDYEVDGKQTEIWGVQYTNQTLQGGVYSTEIVGARRKNHFVVSVSQSYHTQKVGNSINQIKKPRIVSDIITKLGGGYDGDFLIVRTNPNWVKDYDIEFVSDAILNKSGNILPIVYVSRDVNNWSSVNPGNLGILLGGMAHVIVEPDRDFSHKMAKLTNRKNVYKGAVGIYWPNGGVYKIMPDIDSKKMQQEIFDRIIESSLYFELPSHMTFEGIKSLRTREMIKKLREKPTSDRVSSDPELINLLQSELEEKEKSLKEKKELIYQMQQRIAQISTQQTGGIINEPNLNEFHPGEFYGIIYEAIQQHARSVKKGSRRESIINAFLECNPKPDGSNKEEIIQSLKRIFKSNPKPNEVIRQLEQLGFEVNQSGKHPKVSIPEYPMSYTIPSTPSDQRGAENTVNGIKNELL